MVAGTLKSTPQDSNVVPAFHRSSEVPNQGILDPSWPLAQASAFLRALDFGKLPLFPQPRVRLDGKERLITGYRLTAETDDAALDRHARQSAAELRYCDAGLRLTVSLASPAAVSVHHQPVLSQG